MLKVRDGIYHENYAAVDSLLDTTIDTCRLSEVWMTVYEALYQEMSGDTIRRSVNLRDLESIADLCPTENGHIVYIARDLVSRSTGRHFADDNCDRSVDSRSIVTQDKVIEQQLELRPNPTSDKLFFSINEGKIEQVEVYTISGYKVTTLPFFIDSEGYLDVTNLLDGIYLIKCTTDSSEYIERFVVN